MSSKSKRFLENANRIIRLSHKPGWSEFIDTVKVSLLGFGVIGTVGFVIQVVGFVLLSGG